MEGAIVLFALLFFHKCYAAELDMISDSRILTDGDTLVSPTGIFELGFFQPGNSKNTYIGIWYKKISVRTVVWVANRDRPLPSASLAVLKIDDHGNLGMYNNMSMIWSSNTTTSGNATAKLHDTGNFVVTDESDKIIWESFDYPTDTVLPGMKLGRDYLRNKKWYLSSWKNSQDPSLGELTWDIDTLGYPENKLKQGASIIYRGRPWRNKRLIGISQFTNITVTIDVTIKKHEVSSFYNLEHTPILSRLTLNSSAHQQVWAWVDNARGWQVVESHPTDACDKYNICNAYGMCSVNMTQQSCTCLDKKRMVPKNQKIWDAGDWSGGCTRRTTLECKNGLEEFVKYSNVKLPDTENTWFNMSMTLEECHTKCLNNCTCMAYANPDPSLRRRGCMLWFNDLLDMRAVPEGSAVPDIFVRMASFELESRLVSNEKLEGGNIKIILLVTIPGVLIGFVFTWLCYARFKNNHSKTTRKGKTLKTSTSHDEEMEQHLFSFSTIVIATASFSPDNKLGEGGFGVVYKGMLEDGQEIAVKRLSKYSSQGLDEFKNEVICISKLRHRNLVKLLGCCIHGDEKLLIYEYMPNKSLDSFIFDKDQRILLDWTKRVNIIKGVARGLLYLHHDSPLRIIHRDLKASNILLDHDMNPKISDFGLARSFGGNETQGNTQRVVGTYGYMSPEYALNGLFSIKSDVFSFGILVLEILSGKRNRGFIDPENENNFFEHVWSLYDEGRSMELIDASCAEFSHPTEVLRLINVGLLCVQQKAGERPNMSSVVRMMDSESELMQPKKPSFFMENEFPVGNFFSVSSTGGSLNNTSITEVDSR